MPIGIPTVAPPQAVELDLEEPAEPVDTAQALHRGAATEVEETHRYIYAGGKLLRETIFDGETTKTLDFTYDNAGMPYNLIYNNGTTTATYYYITNLQGDVMYLVDANGVQVAAYDYDPYGKVITATGAMAAVNPLRYRGYYYDSETGFYYLQSRYYDPEICRFINADSYASTGQSFLGYNAFAYCGNNPIISADTQGRFWHIVIGAAIGAVVNAITTAIDELRNNDNGLDAFRSGKTWAKIGVSAVTGAVVGGLTATGAGALAIGVVNGVASGVEEAAHQMIDNDGKIESSTKIVSKSAWGFATGYLAGGGVTKKLHFEKVLGASSTVTSRSISKVVTKGLSSGYSYYMKNTWTLQKRVISTLWRDGLKDVAKGALKTITGVSDYI